MEDLRKYSYCSVNLCLAAVEAAVFALCLLTGDRLYAAGRCGTYLVLRDGQYWRLLTSVFLHAGLSHLGSNLIVQILMGDSALGVNTYSVGASGAVFGVMGVLVLLIVRGRKKLRSGSSMLPRAAFAVFYAVYSGFKNPYTDNAAHLGGLAAGVLLGVLFTIGMEDVDLSDLR